MADPTHSAVAAVVEGAGGDPVPAASGTTTATTTTGDSPAGAVPVAASAADGAGVGSSASAGAIAAGAGGDVVPDVSELAAKGAVEDEEDILVYEDDDVIDVGDDEGDAAGDDDDDDDDEDDDDDDGTAEAELGGGFPADSDAPEDMSTAQFTHHTDSAYSVTVSSDGAYAASGDGDDMAYIWRPSSGELVHTLRGHSDSVNCVAFNASSTLLATGSLDSTVKVWHVATGELKSTLEGPTSDIEWLAWHPRGDVILVGSADFTVWMFTAEAACMAVFAGHEGPVTAGGFSKNRVVTASADGTVRVWNPKTSASEFVFRASGGMTFHDAGTPINTLALSSEKPLFITGGADGVCHVGNLKTGKVVATFVHSTKSMPAPVPVGGDEDEGSIAEVDAEDGDGDEDEDAGVEETKAGGAASGAGGTGVGEDDGEDDGDGGEDRDEAGVEDDDEADMVHVSVEGVGFCTSQPWVASAGSDGLVKVWDLTSRTCRHTFDQHAGVTKLLWLPSSAALISCSIDGNVKVWDGRTGDLTATFTGMRDACLDLYVGKTDTDEFAVVVGDDPVARVFSLASVPRK